MTAPGYGQAFKEKIPSGYKKATIQNFTPEQMKLFQDSFSQVGPDSYLSKLAGGDQSLFDEMEAPSLRQFTGMQGNIASKFSGMGMGGRKSSGFGNTMNAAASDFAQQLQSKRQGLQQQAIKDLMSMSHQLMNERPYEQSLVEKPQKESSGWGGIGGAAIGGIGGFLASGGNPMGAMYGASFGHKVGSSF